MASLQITATQQFAVTVMAVDAKGNPSAVENLVFTSSDPTLLTIAPIDASSALVLAAGGIGMAQVVATADADIGEGLVPLTGSLDVTIVSGQAVSLSLAPTLPVEQ